MYRYKKKAFLWVDNLSVILKLDTFLELRHWSTRSKVYWSCVPWKLGGMSWGDMSTTIGWPKYLGICWNTKLLSESTIIKNGFLVKGCRSPGYRLKQFQAFINYTFIQQLLCLHFSLKITLLLFGQLTSPKVIIYSIKIFNLSTFSFTFKKIIILIHHVLLVLKRINVM